MQPCVPDKLPLTDLNWEQLIQLIGKSNAELARYDGILQGIINPELLLAPLLTQEAVLSSKIEGTQATLAEVLEFEALPSKSKAKNEDIQEILSYRQAVRYALDWMKEKPITLNLIKEIHSLLLSSGRGANKRKGEFRTTQNWIGRFGVSIEQASFTPLPPLNLGEYLSNLEKYIHYEEKDRLVQLAVIHAQFEIIHPFLDGNGRVGRILIPLFLFEKELLSRPMFYISAYLETNRELYYAKLRAVTENKDWEGWIQFFLTAVIEQAKENSSIAKAILNLYEDMKEKLSRITHSQFGILDTMFQLPVFNTADFIKTAKISKTNSSRILSILKKEKIITTLRQAIGNRPAVMTFPALLAIVETEGLRSTNGTQTN